jgi:predicted RNA-binding Zn-ribbon protein involved in translation (DUF1610 family)
MRVTVSAHPRRVVFFRVKLIYPVDNCPNCGGELYRSHRRGMVKSTAFRLLLIRAYRCDRCGQRYYIPPTLVFEGSRPAISADPDLRHSANDHP